MNLGIDLFLWISHIDDLESTQIVLMIWSYIYIYLQGFKDLRLSLVFWNLPPSQPSTHTWEAVCRILSLLIPKPWKVPSCITDQRKNIRFLAWHQHFDYIKAWPLNASSVFLFKILVSFHL